MCLTVKQDELPRNIFQKLLGIQPKIKPLIVKRDIVCYKVYKITDIPGVVEAPYRFTKHLVGKPQPKVEFSYNKYGYRFNYSKLLVEGGYHSFVNDNIDLSQFYKSISKLIIKKCIIPKGSEYYIGNWNGVRDAYVSNQLIIL